MQKRLDPILSTARWKSQMEEKKVDEKAKQR